MYDRDLNALKKRYQEHGLLVNPVTDGTKVKDFSIFGFNGVIAYGWAKTGAWDVMTATGAVHTNWLALKRIYFLFDDHDTMVKGTQFILGPINISIGFQSD